MMSQKNKEILIKNRVSLVRNLKATENLLSCLLADCTLTCDMKQRIDAEKTDDSKAGSLLDILMKRPDKAFDSFVRALVETDQDHLAKILNEDEAKNYIKTRNETRLPIESIPNPTKLPNGLIPNPSTLPIDDIKLEETNALDEIDGRNALGKMMIHIQTATNSHLANNSMVYKVNHNPRGRVLIINNHYFIEKSLSAREGAEFDTQNLEELFKKLSFEVEKAENITAEQMKVVVKNESQHSGHEKADMFILFLLSHGCQGYVYGLDGKKISIEEDVASCFSPENCPGLAGKPKIFFIQACQGQLKGKRYAADSGENEVVPEENKQQFEKVASDLERKDEKGFVPGYFKRSDIVMSYATLPGYLAWRNKGIGSFFIRCLVYVFSRKAHSKHLMDMLTEVNALLSKLEASDADGKWGQLAEKSDTLTKKVYFFPGVEFSASK